LIKKIEKIDTVLYTVFHPYSINFLKSFIFNLEKQKFKKFDIFICFNNLKFNKLYLKKLEKLKIKSSFNIFYKFEDKNPIIVRKINIKYLLRKYKKIIFIDSDDTMDPNRMLIINKKLNTYDFIVNNIKSMKKKKIYFKKKNFKIKLQNILDNSFAGLSNFAAKSTALKKIINNIEKKLLVLDWQLITFLLLYKFKGLFVGSVFTFYRIYQHNYISPNDNDNNLAQKKKIKLLHYKFFSKLNKLYVKKLKELTNNISKKYTKKNEFYNT